MQSPLVSIIMPTFRNEQFLGRSVKSALRQTFDDFELIIINDGSGVRTSLLLEDFSADGRIRVVENALNQGLGNVLRAGLALARGEFIAYLASDDSWSEDHLATAVSLLQADQRTYLVYGGMATNSSRLGWRGKTLLGDIEINQESLADDPPRPFGPHSNNLLKLSQVTLRRTLESEVLWTTREQYVSDQLEGEYWKQLLSVGAIFSYSGVISSFWTTHPDQRHRIIAEATRPGSSILAESGRGLSAYRSFYGVPADKHLNWCPSTGPVRKESEYFRGLNLNRSSPNPSTVSRILLVGELGFNPERLLAFTRSGIKIKGLWASNLETWDTASTVPLIDCPQLDSRSWVNELNEFNPDVIYALLNFQAIPLIHEVVMAGLRKPLVFHFKESPQEAIRYGLWSKLVDILNRSSAVVFISAQLRDWMLDALPELTNKPILIMDGDMPLSDRMTGIKKAKLSSLDSAPHTVCVGRPVGLDRVDTLMSLFEQGVHLHVYGRQAPSSKSQWNSIQQSLSCDSVYGPYLHIHDTINPVDWASELSQYDAAWLHMPDPREGKATIKDWSYLNLPARLGTYAAGGLPWLVCEPQGGTTAVGELASGLNNSIVAESVEALIDGLLNKSLLRLVTESAGANQWRLTFDGNLERLLSFFERVA